MDPISKMPTTNVSSNKLNPALGLDSIRLSEFTDQLVDRKQDGDGDNADNQSIISNRSVQGM